MVMDWGGYTSPFKLRWCHNFVNLNMSRIVSFVISVGYKMYSILSMIKKRLYIYYSFQSFEVRSAVCIAGFDWSSLQHVKQTVSKVLPRSSKIALESFHIKQRGDLADGELLVPKVKLTFGQESSVCLKTVFVRCINVELRTKLTGILVNLYYGYTFL